MKTLRVISAMAIVLFALSLGTLSVAADAGDSPANAIMLDNQAHMIQPHVGMWFRFDYDAVNRDISTITLVDANKSGVRFEVWTPDGVMNTGENKPVGRGTAGKVNCDTGDSTNGGGCETSDLTWVGAFATSGTYYVQIVNDNDTAKSAMMTIKGAGVRLGAPTTPNTSTQNTPNTTTQTTPPTQLAPSTSQSVDNPNNSVAIDSAAHTLPAHSATWFKFDYTLPVNQGERLVKTVKLLNGKDSGVRFEVWTPDHVNDWWDNQKPVGQGTVYNVSCTDQATGNPTQCATNDLTWIGSFNIAGTYYVRVVNDNDQASNFTLTIQDQVIK